EILSRDRIRLTFSEPLAAGGGQTPSSFRIEPVGTISTVEWDQATPADVVLGVMGTAIGATGLPTVLTVTGLRSAAGNTLAPEGATVRLSNAATDLADVYVFPNPLVRSEHAEGLMIAGLPAEARVQIFAATGERVRDLSDESGAGGIRWQLTDDAGRSVPSGIYLIRVTASGLGATLKKAAIIN
ncbi:MAG: T9SS type A sorting domain-containing protein, partial [Rhodothermales bacterium]|nr:T9SS type A sorting domain-containing protein [Rhodothermales bacterium]